MGKKQLAKVKVAGTLSEWFRVKKGVRQGCVISPYLFNILAEMVMRETLDGFQGGLQSGGRMITNLHYSDDIVLLATSEAELQELVDRLDHVSHKYSLLIKNTPSPHQVSLSEEHIPKKHLVIGPLRPSSIPQFSHCHNTKKVKETDKIPNIQRGA